MFLPRVNQRRTALDIGDMMAYGASPRASIYLNQAAKAYAFLQGRGYVTSQDVKSIGLDVLLDRVLLTYEAEAEELTADDIVTRIFDMSRRLEGDGKVVTQDDKAC